MELTENEKELIFAQSKQTIQEVSGWKMFIFLPQATTWRFIMIVIVSVKCIYNFTRTFYLTEPFLFPYVDAACDLIYCFDIILSTLHFRMKRTRKLRHGKRRNAFLLVVDYISLLPLEAIYNNTLYNEMKKDLRVGYMMNLVGVLRIYQIPMHFSEIKDSTYRMKIYVFVSIFQMVSYTVLLSHFLSCLIFLYFDEKLQKECLDSFLFCVVENVIETYFLLSHSFVVPFMHYPLQDYRVLLIIDFLIGYIFTYGYVMPLLIFVSIKFLLKYFEYSKQQRQVTVMTDNLIKDKKLRKRVLDYFCELWAFGRVDKQPELLNVFPLGLKKNIFCDMHWEAMRHSYLLQDVSIGCKRSLALCMRTEFLLPNEELFEKNINPTSFLYLESGMLQVMAEENSSTPVLNLSDGTVLGEMSFYLHTRSLATVRAGKFSVVHTLPMRDFFQVLVDYPSDKKQILRKVKARLKFAKSINEIKTNIISHFMPDTDISKASEAKRGNIKWIKGQYRAICHLKYAEKLLYRHEYTVDDYERQILQLDTQMKHTAVNLPYICINEEKTNQQGQVCLKKFLMDPQCQFVSIWRIIIYMVIIITLILYPALIPFCPHIPLWFFSISCIVSLINILDIFLNFFVAVRVKNFALEKFSSVFVYRITNILFLIDLLAAVPFQLFVYDDPKRYGSNLYFLNALFKLYILVPVIYKLNYSPKPHVFIRTASKYLFFIIILVYMTSGVLYVTGVQCLFYDCGDHDWYQILIEELHAKYGIDCAVLRALYLGYGIPAQFSQTGVMQSHLIYFFFFVFFHSFYFLLNGECTAAYVLELTSDVEYRRRINLIYNFMGNHKMVGPLRDRVLSTMRFLWNYDKKNYIAEKEDLWTALPPNLKLRIHLSCTFPVVSKSKLFESEEDEFLMDLCRKFDFLALPANSLLLTLGAQTTRLYIVLKGFVQINSFIAGDLQMNTSRPITARKGDAFPVIDVFSQTPSSVTAVTVTECELLVIELEDVLSQMIIHGVFKDFVEAVKETDLSKLTTARLGVSQFKDVFSEGGVPFGDVFKRLKGLGTFLKLVLLKKALNSHSTFYLYWELSRVVFVVIYCIAWPVAIGCCYNSSAQPLFFQLLSFTELLSTIDFYIRLNVAYYSKIGIFVSHTLYTAVHYLTSAFIADVIAFSPNFHVWYIIFSGSYNLCWQVFVIHVIMRSFSLYRFFGYLSYLKIHGKVSSSILVISVIFSVCLLLHYYICFMMYLCDLGIIQPKFSLIGVEIRESQNSFERYFSELGLTFALAMRGVRFINTVDIYALLVTLIMANLGLMGHIWLFSHLTLTSTNSNKLLTTYQYYMRSFINYLVRQKADDEIINKAVEHFEYAWQEYLKEDLNEIFTSLPQSLHEDITYSLYKTTLEGIICLSGANECFYRTISRHLQEMHLKESSVIIFQKQVQSNIFILHSGMCSIENSSQILYKGAMIGDIKLKGIMTHTITSVTPVRLLKISSLVFFTTLNNFYTTKLAYQAEVDHADDFLVSLFVEKRNEFSINPLQKNIVECEFMPFVEREQENTNTLKKKKRCYMNYNSKVATVFRFIFMLNAYATVIVIPIFIAIRLITPVFLSVIYVLDLIWLLKIIMVPRMITSSYLHNKSRKKWHRFALSLRIMFHIFTVFPLELIPFVHYGFDLSNTPCFIMCFCYINRMLRMSFIFSYFKKKGKKLLVNFFVNVFAIVMLKVAFVNLCCSVNIFLHFNDTFEYHKCYESLSDIQRADLLRSYLCVVNDFISAGMQICLPDTTVEVVFHWLIELWALLSKAFFINYVLMIIYVTHHNKSNQMVQLERLDNYLSARDVSPILRAGAQKYFCNLLNSFYEGANTLFLSSAPAPLKTAIMQNIYMPHLSKCFLFRGLDETFLKQLATRSYLNIFFPGDYIVEKGDVDHNIYFILSGEVYCIQTDTYFQALERATDLYTAGASFGIQQGILPACPHTQTYRAKTLANILVLNYDKWEDLRIAFPETFQAIYKLCLIHSVS